MKKHILIDARIRRASTGRYVDRLLAELTKLKTDYNYTILIEPSDELKIANPRFKIVACRFSQFSFNPLNQILFSWQLYRLKPDLVHFTLTGQQPVFYFGKQVTFTHDLTMLSYARPGRLPKWLHRIRMWAYRFLLWQSHRKAQKIIVPTEYVNQAVKKYHLFVGRKTIVTLEASEPPIKATAKKPNIGEIDNFILYVGSAFPHKNLELLVKSFQTILSKQPDLQLILAGKREYHSKNLEKWANKNNLSENIIFTGFVEESELKWLYENAKCYVFPSLSEGFGLPGLEAMAHGCPVVSSNATCLPEIYGDAAHYFDPNDADDMVASILKVLKDEQLRKKLVSLGYKQVARYSWQKMAEQTLEIYNQVLEN